MAHVNTVAVRPTLDTLATASTVWTTSAAVAAGATADAVLTVFVAVFATVLATPAAPRPLFTTVTASAVEAAAPDDAVFATFAVFRPAPFILVDHVFVPTSEGLGWVFGVGVSPSPPHFFLPISPSGDAQRALFCVTI